MTVVVAVSQEIDENGRVRVGCRASLLERRSVPASYWDRQPYGTG